MRFLFKINENILWQDVIDSDGTFSSSDIMYCAWEQIETNTQAIQWIENDATVLSNMIIQLNQLRPNTSKDFESQTPVRDIVRSYIHEVGERLVVRSILKEKWLHKVKLILETKITDNENNLINLIITFL